jgi:protein involved in ribonucleotide reduction
MEQKTKNKKSISKKTKIKKDSDNVIIEEVTKEELKEKYIMVCNVKYGNEIYKIGDEVPKPLQKLFINKKFCNICEG